MMPRSHLQVRYTGGAAFQADDDGPEGPSYNRDRDMSKRGSRTQKRPPAPGGELSHATRDIVRQMLGAGLVALLVATPLVPSEAPGTTGTGVLWNLLWLLLLVGWALAAWVWPPAGVRWHVVDTAFLAFLAWHSLSAVVMAHQGDARAAINLLWQWVSFGVCFFLARQLLHEAIAGRACCALLAALAVCLAGLAIYQYAYSLPQMRAEYAREPERTLREAGIESPPGSPERKLFEDRLQSTEPTATFALTNSLAGFLAPWFVMLIAVGVAVVAGPRSAPAGYGRWPVLCGTAVGGLLVGFCLLLTKSRTAWLAVGLGLLLLAWSRWRGGRRIDWRIPLAGTVVLAVLCAGAVAAGAFDWLVLSEAPKSVLYRVQYWRATLALIADHPWFGCGPGNFQQYYTAYKLPEASETVADPHNFLLEVWATAGTPALLAFLGIGLLFVGKLVRGIAGSPRAEVGAAGGDSAGWEAVDEGDVARGAGPRSASGNRSAAATVMWLYGGGLVGTLLAYPCGAVVGFMPDPMLLVTGLPVAIGVLALLHGWVRRGAWSDAMLVLPLVVLLVNLLAAGGLSFAGVAQSGWLLVALVLNRREAAGTVARGGEEDACAAAETRPVRSGTGRADKRPGLESQATVESGRARSGAGRADRRPGLESQATGGARRVGGAVLLLALLLTVAYHRTGYAPNLHRQVWMSAGSAAEAAGQFGDAERAFAQAARADPYAAEPWLRLAWLAQQGAAAMRTPESVRKFEQVLAEAARRCPRSSAAWRQFGDCRFSLYRATLDERQLQAAIDAYQRVVTLAPNNAYAHAQLAWAQHVAGRHEQAAREAVEALRLDALNPHREKKLAQQQVYDPGSGPRPENAEQCMQRVRTRQ